MSAPYYNRYGVTVHHGDCLDVVASLPDASVHAVCTDPPYGIRFMGKAWDGLDIEDGVALRRSQAAMPDDGRAGANGGYRSAAAEAGRYDLSANAAFGEWCRQWTSECRRVLKPGGHLVSFGGARTWHRLASAVEDADFEVRDSIAWLYATGFPKSHNLDGDWQGWGTALKPGFEPIVVARKPLAGTVAANVLMHGVGALNIDGCRVGTEQRINHPGGTSSLQRVSRVEQGYRGRVTASVGEASAVVGRWPTNVVLTHAATPDGVDLCVDGCVPGCVVADLDEQAGERVSGSRRAGDYGLMGYQGAEVAPMPAVEGDRGGASRFFPVFRFEAKAPTAERPRVDGVAHPTVKPLALMRWLTRLVTPPGGTVLDPFLGSGTTAQAARAEGFRCIGVEREDSYLPLIRSRLDGGGNDLFGGAA